MSARFSNCSCLYIWLSIFFISQLESSLATKLAQFKSCDLLRKYFVSNAVRRIGPYGLDQPTFFLKSQPEVADDALGPGLSNTKKPAAANSATPTQGVDFSGTNAQVKNVDEPDFIKTDGRFVYVLSKETLNVVRVTQNGMNGTLSGRIKLPEPPASMLIHKNHIVLFASSYTYFRSYPRSSQNTIVYHVKIMSSGRPVLRETVQVDGRFITARSVGDTVRLVLSYNPTAAFRFTYQRNNSKTERIRATRLNKRVITEASRNIWIPKYSFDERVCSAGPKGKKVCKTNQRKSWLIGCAGMYYPYEQFSGFRLVSVATFQIGSPIRPRGASIVADGDTVYSSINSLYVVTTPYMWDIRRWSTPRRKLNDYKTSFHKFSIESSAAPKYVASGEAQGSILNQFSMHEYDDTFFIATTNSFPWDTNPKSSSAVLAFRQYWKDPDLLRQIGYVGKLGIGERIYAVRYIADVAYVVTFREVDPLYIIDLADPFDLKKRGELKIPGYSTYLHPVGNGKLLGVGQEATLQGRITGAKVSLFDVSDVSKPIQVSAWKLNDSFTDAEWDHKAFLYWGPQQAAVLPLTVYNRFSLSFAGSIVLNVLDNKVSAKGRVKHQCCGGPYDRPVVRNLVLGKVFLWSMSRRALQINDIRSLKFKNNVRLSGY